MFTIATAITRMGLGKYDLFLGMSPLQKLQRINDVLSAFYIQATWRGVLVEITPVIVDGKITLSEAYLRLDALNIVVANNMGRVPIVDIQYKYRPNGTGPYENTDDCQIVAIDQGDNANGQRVYQLTGDLTTINALTFSALARKRYVYATSTTTTVVPDCYPALELGVRAMNASDEQAHELSLALWSDSFSRLDADLKEFTIGNPYGPMQIDPMATMGLFNTIL